MFNVFIILSEQLHDNESVGVNCMYAILTVCVLMKVMFNGIKLAVLSTDVGC